MHPATRRFGRRATATTTKRRSFSDVLVVGDSIVWNGISAGIGWLYETGMAASSADTDWVTVLGDMLGATMYRPTKDGVCSGAFPTCVDNLALYSGVDLVLVMAGEHFLASTVRLTTIADINTWCDTIEAFAATEGIPVAYVSRWSETGPPYLDTGDTIVGNNLLIDRCNGTDRIYVDITNKLNGDSDCFGYPPGGDPGVTWHPNDQGHRGIANLVYNAITVVP